MGTPSGSKTVSRSRKRALQIALVLSLVVVQSASANNVGSSISAGNTPAHICDKTTSSQCVAENWIQSVYFSSVSSDLHGESTWSIAAYNSEVPDILFYESSTSVNADVIVSTVNLPAVNALAWGQCLGNPGDAGVTFGGSEANHDRWCRPQLLKWNVFFKSGYFATANPQRYIACHELGHTMGLRHSNEASGSCMIKATITPKYVPTFTIASSHDQTMLAGHY